MSFLKCILKYILTAPNCFIHKSVGIDVAYKDMVDFFRYFPFGRIHKDKTVSFRFMGQKVKMLYRGKKPVGCAIFKNGEYDLIPESDREVLDIGSAHGDSAIFFSLRGAREVYGYELQGENCILAKKNIKLNNLSNIKIFHCGVASKKINSSDKILGAILQKDEYNMIDSADFKTLDQIAKLHGIKNAVLKLDVDGFEYEILRSTSVETLNKFDFIFIEYHFGVQDLNSILLNSGFYCQSEEVSTINADWHPQELRSMNVGYIFATKKSM